MSSVKLPECWGHRGASARYPENTLASFEAAMRDGAEGIESDVHVSVDDVVIMFHDPTLERTTDGKGTIREQNWFGEEGIEHVRTLKEPRQAIPTFAQTIELLMRPENHHVKFNIDVKVQNDPPRLFNLMHTIISSYDDWQSALAPRILLGLWHPRFLPHAEKILPYCRRSYIGVSPALVKKHFWDSCEVFSMSFASLATATGERFRNSCKAAGKEIMVWTVNEAAHMMEAVRWGVDVILTDKTNAWLELRTGLKNDYEKISAKHSSRLFLWTQPRYYGFFQMGIEYRAAVRLERAGGPMAESRSWTSVVKEKAGLTPPATPPRKTIEVPLV